MAEIVETSQVKSAKALAGIEGSNDDHLLETVLEVLNATQEATNSIPTASIKQVASAFRDIYGQGINEKLLAHFLSNLKKSHTLFFFHNGSSTDVSLTPLGGEVLRLWRDSSKVEDG